MATASTSRRGSKPWPMPAGCSSPIPSMIKCGTACPLPSRIWASRKSRTLPGPCGITAQLIDALSGTHLWADRFDGSLEDVFELQDKVASSVAGVMEPTLQAAEIRRSSERPTSDLTAYDWYLRALPHQFSFATDRSTLVLDLLGRAIERDPRYWPALPLAALFHAQLDVHCSSDAAA